MAPTNSHVPIQIHNLTDGEEIYGIRLLLVHGTAGPLAPGDATIRVDGSPQFPPQLWQVTDGYFKALVPLSPGPNHLVFTYLAEPCPIPTPRLPPLDGFVDSSMSTRITVNMLPMLDKPPLHLAIIVARDSPMTVDCPPERRGFDDSFEAVKRKLALQVYTWQAYTAEQMRRHRFGRRAFRLDEVPSSERQHTLSTLPKIHILHSKRSVQEFRDKDNAQQYQGAKHGGAMLDFVTEILDSPACPSELRHGTGAHVACLTLDAHWDAQSKLLRGHAAVGFGGPGPGRKVGVMGSHWIHAAPLDLEEVTMRFLDTRATDERHCVNDLGECGTNWETLNIGSGAFLHETGHVLNNPHHPSGIMLRGYQEWNRAFMTREAYSSRRRTQGFRPITAEDDDVCHWHRLAAIRFRYHPLFHLPRDPQIPCVVENPKYQGPDGWQRYEEDEPSWQLTDGAVTLLVPAGAACVEFQVDGRFKTHFEWPYMDPASQPPPPSSLVFPPEYVSNLLHVDAMRAKVTLSAIATNHRQAEIPDFKNMFQQISLPGLQGGVMKTVVRGVEADDPRRHWIAPFPDRTPHGRAAGIRLVRVSVFAGAFLDGILFHYSDRSSQPYGSTTNSTPAHFDLQPGEDLAMLNVRSGGWIDALQIVTTLGRSSPFYGGGGGGVRSIEAPPGYVLVGLYGSSNDGGGKPGWVTSLGGLYQRG